MRHLVVVSLLIALISIDGAQADQSSIQDVLKSPSINSPATESKAMPSLLQPNFTPGSFALGKVILNPYVQIGYQRVSANSSFPILTERIFPVDNTLQIGSMELELKDIYLWSWTLGVNAVINPSVSIFASFLGFIPTTYPVYAQLPTSVNGTALPSEVNFTGENTEYRLGQFGASITLAPGYSLLVGSLWDHFTNTCNEPRTGTRPFPDQTLRADYWINTWAPYLGLQFVDRGLTASVIYTPLIYAQSLMALRSSQLAPIELQYSFNKPGQFLSANASYDLPKVAPPLSAQMWGSALWMNIKGEGDFDYVNGNNGVHRSGSASEASSTKYAIGGGITFGLIF